LLDDAVLDLICPQSVFAGERFPDGTVVVTAHPVYLLELINVVDAYRPHQSHWIARYLKLQADPIVLAPVMTPHEHAARIARAKAANSELAALAQKGCSKLRLQILARHTHRPLDSRLALRRC
jgi:hypothetical protein